MKLKLTLIATSLLLLSGCDDKGLESLFDEAIDEAIAEQARKESINNPFVVVEEASANVPVPISVQVQPAPQVVVPAPVVTPEPVIVVPAPVAPVVILEPTPVVPTPVVDDPVVVPTPTPLTEMTFQEIEAMFFEGEIPDPIEPELDLDGETIFFTQEVSGRWTPRAGWVDSYSVGNRCYIYSTLDHNIGDIVVETPFGDRTVAMVQQILGDGPGIDVEGVALFNDVQCGNGPANDFGDEDQGECPGRIDMGRDGCGITGPEWYFD